jgi:von Willebrand factor type A domain
MLTLAYPWLLMLIVLPLFLHRLLPAYRQIKTGVAVPFLARLAALTGQQPASGAFVVRPHQVQQMFRWIAWLCIVAALARPQWLEKPITKTLPTRDLLLAVDLSGSMETQDFTNAVGQRVDRLTAVKEVLDDFLTARKGDRVGLIFFGSAAYVQAPFTEDLAACRTLLDEAQVRMADPKTALGDAIGLAAGRRSAFEYGLPSRLDCADGPASKASYTRNGSGSGRYGCSAPKRDRVEPVSFPTSLVAAGADPGVVAGLDDPSAPGRSTTLAWCD